MFDRQGSEISVGPHCWHLKAPPHHILPSRGSQLVGREPAGGITPDNAHLVIEAGANALVAGSAVFGASASPSIMRTLATFVMQCGDSLQPASVAAHCTKHNCRFGVQLQSLECKPKLGGGIHKCVQIALAMVSVFSSCSVCPGSNLFCAI